MLPALVLSYFGQGALLLREPVALAQPFHQPAPGGLLYPMIGLATVATVIAAQAAIPGMLSITQQAFQLGQPRRPRSAGSACRG